MGLTNTKKSKGDSLHHLDHHASTRGPFSRPLFTSLPTDVQRGLLIGPMQARKKFAEGQQRLKDSKLVLATNSTLNTTNNDTFPHMQSGTGFNPMKRSLDDED